MAANPLPQTNVVDQEATHNFAFKVVADLSAAISGPLVYLGDRLGLFKAIRKAGSLTVQQLADRTGLQERYLREWASAMVTAEYLDYDPKRGEITLPAEKAAVLAEEDNPFFAMGMAQMIPDHYRILPLIEKAFHDGGGVPYTEYSEDTFIGTERLFRTGYVNFLAQEWIPAMPDVHNKLKSGAKVLDVGCGRGQALLALAKAFPNSEFIGCDNYAPNLAYASELARKNGAEKRLRFEERNATQLPQTHDFDLVMTCDCLHDMVTPEGCARSIRGAISPQGTWFCIEPNVRDRLEENINPIGRLFYSVSTLQCMTCSLAHDGAGYGTGMGEANVRKIAQLAGFTQFRRLPLEHPFNQFFEIKP